MSAPKQTFPVVRITPRDLKLGRLLRSNDSSCRHSGRIAKGRGVVTDHGTEHVRTVIRRASELINNATDFEMSCYETYLLLASIHVHDIGNMSGREGHELGSADIIQQLGAVFGPDDVEKRMIFKIAQAHGGRVGADKDKIAKLQEVDHLLGQKVKPVPWPLSEIRGRARGR